MKVIVEVGMRFRGALLAALAVALPSALAMASPKHASAERNRSSGTGAPPPSGGKRSGDKGQHSLATGPELSVLSWNVFLRPRSVILRDGQFERARRMPEHLVSQEVVVLAEAFDNRARRTLMKGLAATHPYQ